MVQGRRAVAVGKAAGKWKWRLGSHSDRDLDRLWEVEVRANARRAEIFAANETLRTPPRLLTWRFGALRVPLW